MNRFKIKIVEWVNRYGPAEVTGVVMALAVASITHALTQNLIFAGIAGTWAENLGFYSVMMIKEILSQHEKNPATRRGTSIMRALRAIGLEFGPSEYLDSFLIRPLYFSTIPLIVSNYSAAIVIGSLLADLTFFTPAIISYELQKKHFKN